jgi:Superfamily II DNA and RNA helicases
MIYNIIGTLYPQVMRIIENIRPDRQTVMFSATFPRQMEALARRILTKPIEIQVFTIVAACILFSLTVIVEKGKFQYLSSYQ